MRLVDLIVPLVCSACGLSTDHFTGPGGAGTGDSDAGGSIGPAPNDPHDGTRLQLTRYVFGSASTVVGIHDVQTDLDCGPTMWSDGHQRCTPSTMSLGFTDATCTQPIGWDLDVSNGGLAKGFVADLEANSSSLRHLYRRGGALSLMSWYQVQGGSCQLAALSGYKAYALGDEVAADTLAEVTVEPVTIGEFTMQMIRSSDGLQLQSQGFLHDTAYDVDCYLYPNGKDIVCNPYPFAGRVFTDASCTSPVAANTYQTTGKITLVNDGYDTCTGASYSRVGSAVTPTPTSLWAFDNTNTCMPTTVNPALTYYAVGAPAPLTPFKQVTTGPDRIQQTGLVAGPLHVASQLYDSMLDMSCLISTASDGIPRCLPSFGAIAAFSDSNCQQELDYVSVFQRSSCVVTPAPTYAMIYGSTSSPLVRKVGARYLGPIYFITGGICEARDDGSPHYLATTHAPLDVFAVGAIKTGP
jgi:hypothetical protein